MKLSKQEVENIARLARLGLTAEEKRKYGEQLSSILDYVKQLEEVDTKDVKPTSQVTGLSSVFRDDKVEKIEKDKRDKLLKQAPSVEDDLIKANSVFE